MDRWAGSWFRSKPRACRRMKKARKSRFNLSARGLSFTKSATERGTVRAMSPTSSREEMQHGRAEKTDHPGGAGHREGGSIIAMRVFVLCAVLCFCMTFAGGTFSQAPAPAPTLAIQHVNIVDVRAGRVLEDRTVVIENGRITQVNPARHAKTPAGATIIDGRSRYLIPGLWDMHVHAAWPGIAQVFAPLFIANGVTGVREM